MSKIVPEGYARCVIFELPTVSNVRAIAARRRRDHPGPSVFLMSWGATYYMRRAVNRLRAVSWRWSDASIDDRFHTKRVPRHPVKRAGKRRLACAR